jgi:hypothetical protein
MRFQEFKLYHSPTQLNEGYTKGDLAETVWGAAVTAAFAKYPNPADKGDIISVIQKLDKSLTYINTRTDGMESSITDKVVFKNLINMKAHIDDLRNISSSIDNISKELPGIISDANAQVKSAGLQLQDIFANGIADAIQIGAEGGADQKGTKVDVSIVHTDSDGKREVKRLGYSLKTDTAGRGVMPVGQFPGINKGSGGQIEFFADIDVLDDIDDASIEAYNELEEKLRNLVNKNTSDGRLEKVYEKELRAVRRENEGVQAWNKNIVKAAAQINKQIDTDGEEAAFLSSIVAFLKKHINKDEDDIKLLTFDKSGAYTTTVQEFQKNVSNLTIKAEANTKLGELKILSITDEGTDLIFKMRFVCSGGRFSGSSYKKSLKQKSVKDGKKEASGYELLRYKMYVETGPGYKKSAQIS